MDTTVLDTTILDFDLYSISREVHKAVEQFQQAKIGKREKSLVQDLVKFAQALEKGNVPESRWLLDEIEKLTHSNQVEARVGSRRLTNLERAHALLGLQLSLEKSLQNLKLYLMIG